MEPLTIRLPDPALRAFVDNLVTNGVYASASDYIEALIGEDRKRRNQARLEALLLEGLEGEGSELAASDFDEMRRQYDERHSDRAHP